MLALATSARAWSAALGCAVMVIACGESRAPRTPPRDVDGDIATADSSIHFWSRGGSAGANVLVLINGGPGLSHESMEPLQDALASPAWQVVTYDQRGVGRSTASGSAAFTPDEYVADLETLRQHLGIARVHLLGHSFGGMIALRYLDRFPDAVASLTLVDTGVADAEAMRAGGEALGRRVTELQRQGIIRDPIPTSNCRDRFLAVAPAYFADPHFVAPPAMVKRTCDDSGRSAVLDAFIAAPYTAGVASATLPVLVVIGASDPLAPSSRAAAAALSHAEVSVTELAACGHLGWLECPQPFLAAVRPFLDRAGRAR
jgi:pimeloyl-ACP methyl ester carboxylesterase